MEDLPERKQRLADALFDAGAIMFGEFALKLHEKHPDAPKSPIYLNLRTTDNPKSGPLTPEMVDDAAQLMLEIVCSHPELLPRRICGLPNAGDPFAASLAQKMHALNAWLMHLTKATENGLRRISDVHDGEFVQGDPVLLVEDLITKADSKLEAIQVVEKIGLRVCGVIVLVDRDQGGSKQLKSLGFPVHSVFTLADLLRHYVQTDKIQPATRTRVLEYLANSG